jgi:hypothetical protein
MSGAAGAAAAARIQAIKASGAIVRVAPDDFGKLLNQNAHGLVVHATRWLFSTSHVYVMGYQGLVFYTKTSDELHVPSTCQVVQASKIWTP